MPRPRKPKSQHERDGTYRADRHGSGGLPVEVPPMPPTLPAGVQAVWKDVCGRLERAGLVSEVDGMVLHRLAELCWVATEAFDAIQSKGLTVEQTNKGGHTNTVPNPAARIYFVAVKQITQIAQQFGMTATARNAMHLAGDDEGDEAEDIVGFSVN